uniref:Uncharacterized protein n=1 Tax=Oryza nivara TaxID=4536 RepID=A0A0E0G7Q3_ORYNI
MPDGREGIWELRITRHWPNQYSLHNQCIPLRHLKATKKSIENVSTNYTRWTRGVKPGEICKDVISDQEAMA